ncbi:hypothetical protein Q8A64_16745 [Oxalobacteraceae bacterium R-40]|uniref:Uncharacterized protein n=1 Tax=Keguizhuia sedimenti TaxID=3064264 RepID=A0ABU1BSR2_9BURK|nr:hypothetical protein [Oxalobacteraceae bacterium R-40]
MLVQQTVFMGQGRQWFAKLDGRPQQESFSFLAVVVERCFGIEKAGQPRLDGIDIIVCSNLGPITESTVGAIVSIEQGRDRYRFQR